MKETIFEDATPEQRAQMLHDNCYAIEDAQLKRFHTPEQKESLRNTATDEMIKCQDIEEKIKELTEPLKGELKTVKSELRSHLASFKRGYESEDGKLYAFDDQEESMMNFYDVEGKLVKSRRLYPTEKQTKIISMTKDNAS